MIDDVNRSKVTYKVLFRTVIDGDDPRPVPILYDAKGKPLTWKSKKQPLGFRIR